MNIIDRYISYIRDVKRYSVRTVDIYGGALRDYMASIDKCGDAFDDEQIIASMNRSEIRQYEAEMLEKKMSARTVRLHLSALSGFCRYLVRNGYLESNPVDIVAKPKEEKRLPVFFKKNVMDSYFEETSAVLDPEELDFFKENHDTGSGRAIYDARLYRLIVSMLYNLGLRRAELIGLNIGNVDFGRKVVNVHGKGDKSRKIPLIPSLCKEILLYLEAVEAICGGKRSLKEPLLVTNSGKRLYPAFVDRAVKRELGKIDGITGRKSPHVLRHSLATELLNDGTDISSIKELLGHSSLAATQVYTHSNVSRLKHIYESAHPRAKNGGKNGD